MTITDYLLQKEKFQFLGEGAEGEVRLISENLVAKYYRQSDYTDRNTTLKKVLITRKYIESLCKKIPSLDRFIALPELAGYVIEDNQLLLFTEYIESNVHKDCVKCYGLLKLAAKLKNDDWGLSDVSESVGNFKIKDHKIYLIDVHAWQEYTRLKL